MRIFSHILPHWLLPVLYFSFSLFCSLNASMVRAQTYYLPKTVVRFHLLIEKETYQPGDFARYAERYLRLTGVAQQQQVNHRVIDCHLSTIGVRDTSKCFVAHLKGKGEKAAFHLSDDGVLLAINDEPLPSPSRQFFPRTTATPQGSQLSTHSVLSAEALAAGSKAKMAEITAQQIIDLREQRQLLATGEADNMPQDDQQLQYMLQRIDQQHDQLMALFVGTTVRDTTEHQILYCPDSEVTHHILFRMSRRMGIVDCDDLAGVPYYISIRNLYPTEQPLLDNKKGEHLYANIPGMARLTLQYQDAELGSYDIPVAQFGIVELRDGSFFKRYVTHLQLHPATGAVVKMVCEDKK